MSVKSDADMRRRGDSYEGPSENSYHSSQKEAENIFQQQPSIVNASDLELSDKEDE